MDSLEPRMKLYNHGFGEYEYPSSEPEWKCSWNNPSSASQVHTTTAICVTPSSLSPGPPEDCVCPSVQPLEERFVRSEGGGIMPPGQVTSVSISCSEDALLLGGSCVMPFEMVGNNRFVHLVSMGFAKDASNNDVWECAWNNGSPATLAPSAVAICLRPPTAGSAPEAEPTATRLVHVEDREVLRASNNLIHDATCADGDFLLWGSCTLENPAAAPRDLNIFRSGFMIPAANRPNTWQCGWNNPTTSTPIVIATALCLKPPSAAP